MSRFKSIHILCLHISCNAISFLNGLKGHFCLLKSRFLEGRQDEHAKYDFGTIETARKFKKFIARLKSYCWKNNFEFSHSFQSIKRKQIHFNKLMIKASTGSLDCCNSEQTSHLDCQHSSFELIGAKVKSAFSQNNQLLISQLPRRFAFPQNSSLLQNAVQPQPGTTFWRICHVSRDPLLVRIDRGRGWRPLSHGKW